MRQHKEALIAQIGWDKKGNVYKGYWLDDEFHVPLNEDDKRRKTTELHIPADEMHCWYEESLLLIAASKFDEEGKEV